MITFLYDGTPEGIICAAVQAFRSKAMPDRVIADYETYQPVLFDEVIRVETDKKLADRGIRYLKKDINLILHAFLLDTECDYAVLVKCLCGLFRDINHLDRYDLEDVKHVHKCAKRTLTEKHRMVEFIRFKELSDGYFLAEIEPCANVLGLIAEHFTKRLPSEKWMVYDRIRRLLLAYDGGSIRYSDAEMTEQPKFSPAEERFQELWQVFFKNIAIKERVNLKLQQQHVPDKYRKLMTEFSADNYQQC